ncbi:MAG: hypothetical protein Q9170_007585 [Blastenia crenularia]
MLATFYYLRMWKIPSLFSYSSSATTPALLSAPAQLVAQDVGQEKVSAEGAQAMAEDNLLVASPYTSRPHLLDLTTLNGSQILLAKALSLLTPVTDAYATFTYTESFNWDAVFTCLAAAVKSEAVQWKEQFFYIVVFRSQIPPTTDRSHLAELDKAAHIEAMKSGGLLKYWFGKPDDDGRNLATCKQVKPPSYLQTF